MSIEFGLFDHIEPVDRMPLNEVYRLRMKQLEAFDNHGVYAYQSVLMLFGYQEM